MEIKKKEFGRSIATAAIETAGQPAVIGLDHKKSEMLHRLALCP